MITPFIMLLLMTAPWLGIRLLAQRGWSGEREEAAGAVGLGLLFVFTGAGHFLQTAAMAEMLPPFVPARVALVYVTGLLEWAIALGFFVARWRLFVGLLAAAVLIGFFPANIYAAFVQAPMGGHAWGPVYLLVRAPLQLAILLWTWRFAIRPGLRRGEQPEPARMMPWPRRENVLRDRRAS